MRKAEKAGLLVEEQPRAEITSRFADFYRQGMINIGGEASYLFSDAYFSALAELRTVTLLVCRQGNDWLSAGLFLKGELSLEYHLSTTTHIGRKLSATNLLLDVAASWARDCGLESLYLGGGTDGQVDNPLLFFKGSFSPARLPFRYAFCIHQPELYSSLRDSYQQAGGKSSRVLFYRKAAEC